MNQKQTLKADDPDVESFTEHDSPWRDAFGRERADRPVHSISMGLSSLIHGKKVVNGWDTDIKHLAVSKPRSLSPHRCFCPSRKALRLSYRFSDHLSTISEGAIH
jgi:hypothetical protein